MNWKNLFFSIVIIYIGFQSYVLAFTSDYILSSYGNELNQFNRYYLYTSNLTNETNLYNKLYYCFGNNFMRSIACIVNELVIVQNIRKTPDQKLYYKQVDVGLDCNYQINLKSINFDQTHFTYNFEIIQSKCQTPHELLGGTSFDSFGMTNNSLIGCQTFDLFNNSYQLICSEVITTPIINIPPIQCISLYVYIVHEHYEHFGEIAYTKEFYAANLYNITNIYCQNIIQSNTLSQISSVSSLQQMNKVSDNNNDIDIYSGRWIKQKDNNDSYIFQPILFKSLTNETIIYEVSYPQQSHPSVEFLSILSKNVISYNNSFNSNSNNNNNNSTNSNKNSNKNKNKNKNVYRNNNLHSYHFLGSSHMRYTFNYLAEMVYGNEIFNGIPKHHATYSVHNLHGHVSNSAFQHIFADDSADYLKNMCNNFNKSLNHTIIFMTGAWDVKYLPMRRLFKANVGPKLIQSMYDILNDNYSCNHLKHFIWMTSMPYPINLNESDHVQVARGYRYNDIISTVNQYYLSNILKYQNITKKLTIIDTYNIIKPRLLYNNQTTEFACRYHYLCRHGFGSNFLPIFTTPGGIAYMNALILALKSYSQ